MSLAESLDGTIERIIRKDEDSVRAIVRIPLLNEQLSYFAEHLEKGNVITDLFSTLAVSGVNQSLEKPEEIESFTLWKNELSPSIAYEATFSKFMPKFFHTKDGRVIGLDKLLIQGTPVSKLYVKNPELAFTAAETINHLNSSILHTAAIRGKRSEQHPSGKVIAESVVHEDGRIEVPIQPIQYLPHNALLDERTLRKIFDKKKRRTDLWIYRSAKELALGEGITIPENEGVLTYTYFNSGTNEVVIEDDFHSDARVLTKYSNGNILLELLPNGMPRTVKTVNMRIYRQPSITPKKHFLGGFEGVEKSLDFVLKEMERTESSLNDSERRYSPSFIATLKRDGVLLPLVSIRRGDHENYSELERQIQDGSESVLYMSHAPSNMMTSFLVKNSKKLKAMCFRDPDFDEQYFTQEAFNHLKNLAREGVDVYWKNTSLDKLMRLHGDFFVERGKEVIFEEYSKSRKIGAFYGSARSAGADVLGMIENTFDAFAKFWGGNCGAVTGGMGDDPSLPLEEKSVMVLMRLAARKRGLLYGASSWDIPYEGPVEDADFIMPLARKDLATRQDIMDDLTGPNFYFEGGFGTDLEAGLRLVKASLKIDPHKPMIFIGDYYLKKKEWMEHVITEGRASPSIMDSVYFDKDGLGVSNILKFHYKKMDVPIRATVR